MAHINGNSVRRTAAMQACSALALYYMFVHLPAMQLHWWVARNRAHYRNAASISSSGTTHSST